MRASVVIRSKDEADRLRLVLASLARQTVPAEIVVVNDGSSDHTAAVVAAAGSYLDIVALINAMPTGRSAASNRGAAMAGGDILIFLDGDTLAAPDMVARHLASHEAAHAVVARGETWHLRSTRPFADPEAGTAQPGLEARVARMSPTELERSLVTRSQIAGDFDAVAARGQPGVYPGYGPRRLFELEMQALSDHPDCPVLWAAASGSNQSVARAAFLDAGGFDARITNNEHRELALRLCQRGLRMVGCPARTYHMTHRSGWRDPLVENDWESIFFDAHPIAEVALLAVFWASLADVGTLPSAARINTLPELAAAAARYRSIEGCEAIRSAHLRWAREAAAA